MKMLFIWPAAEFSTYDVARGINRALKAAGHEVIDYRLYLRIQAASIGLHAMFGAENDDDPLAPDHVATLVHASEGILHNAVLNGCRWVFFVNGMGLHPDALLTLRRCGLKIAGWFTEGPYDTTDEKELRLAQFCDVAFVNDRAALDSFPCLTQYLPHAYDPEVHKPDPKKEASDRVIFIGTGFAERQILFEQIDWTGIDFHLGGLWSGVKPPSFLSKYITWPCLANDDTVREYQNAAIVLNPHRRSAVAYSANPRVFEAAASGVFQISDYRPEIEEIFGDAVVTYRPQVPWELESKIRHYLAHPAERLAKVHAARKLVRPHTFAARAKTIYEALCSVDKSLPLGAQRREAA